VLTSVRPVTLFSVTPEMVSPAVGDDAVVPLMLPTLQIIGEPTVTLLLPPSVPPVRFNRAGVNHTSPLNWPCRPKCSALPPDMV